MTQLRLLLLSLLFALSTANANAQVTITTQAVGEYARIAAEAALNEDYPAAIAAMRQAAKVPDITPAERYFVEQSILAYMVQMKDYVSALTQVKKMLANNIVNTYENVGTCVRLMLIGGATAFNEECLSIIPRPVQAPQGNNADGAPSCLQLYHEFGLDAVPADCLYKAPAPPVEEPEPCGWDCFVSPERRDQ